jgi:hypothetical protein
VKILALDIATSTGVAFGDSKGQPRAWTVHLGKAPDERRFANALRMTAKMIVENEPELIVVEAAVGGPKASAFLIGLLACVRGVAFDRGIPCHTVHLGTIRKHFLGKALTTRDFPHLKPVDAKKAIKARVIQRCGVVGWSVDNDDEADALALWDYACATYAPKYQSKTVGGLV